MSLVIGITVLIYGSIIFAICYALYVLYVIFVRNGTNGSARRWAERVKSYTIISQTEIIKEHMEPTGVSLGYNMRTYYRFKDEHTGVYKYVIDAKYKKRGSERRIIRSDSNWYKYLVSECENRSKVIQNTKVKSSHVELLLIEEEKLNRAEDAYIDGIDTLEEYKEKKTRILADIDRIKREES